MKLTKITLATLCLSGLLAACQGSPEPTSGESQTLRLHRLENGNYEYCDADGNCQELPPNGGDCAVLEIRVDLSTGESCQSCILADGSVIDQGCSGAAVVCTMVTVPEPDCTVCAYVNGAIVFSSCIPDNGPTPECVTDVDCQRDGTYGRCDGGYCVYEPVASCTSDAECAAGEYCQLDTCPAAPCWLEDLNGNGEFEDGEWICPTCYGRCLPAGGGVGCEAMLCGPGTVCVERQVQCFAAPCDPIAECVPTNECSADADCGDGGLCIIDGCTEMACPEFNPNCNRCFGHCVWEEPPTDPCAVVDCAPGYVCQVTEIWCITTPCEPIVECVPEGSFDCSSPVFCDALPPRCDIGEVPSVENGCWGPCVPEWSCLPPSDCVVSGCSGEICAAEYVDSACIWLEEYACYAGAICERDADGVCGWRQTPELAACIAQAAP